MASRQRRSFPSANAVEDDYREDENRGRNERRNERGSSGRIPRWRRMLGHLPWSVRVLALYFWLMESISHFLLLALLILYVISPLDLIPDIIPIIGLLDDAAGVLGAVTFAQSRLVKERHLEQARVFLGLASQSRD